MSGIGSSEREELAVDQVVMFRVEKSPTWAIKRGSCHAGTVKLIRGDRVSIEDDNGFRYVTSKSRVTPPFKKEQK